jgi:hypothetical protein
MTGLGTLEFDTVPDHPHALQAAAISKHFKPTFEIAWSGSLKNLTSLTLGWSAWLFNECIPLDLHLRYLEILQITVDDSGDGYPRSIDEKCCSTVIPTLAANHASSLRELEVTIRVFEHHCNLTSMFQGLRGLRELRRLHIRGYWSCSSAGHPIAACLAKKKLAHKAEFCELLSVKVTQNLHN